MAHVCCRWLFGVSHGSLLLPLGLGCLKPIQIVYVPMVSTPLKKCLDLPYINTDTNEAKYELNIAVYYYVCEYKLERIM